MSLVIENLFLLYNQLIFII